DLFPVFVHERLGGVDSGREAQQPRARTAPVGLIERAGEDLLLNAGGIAGRSLPPGGHVDGVEFLVFLVDAHGLESPSAVCRVNQVNQEIVTSRASVRLRPAGCARWQRSRAGDSVPR